LPASGPGVMDTWLCLCLHSRLGEALGSAGPEGSDHERPDQVLTCPAYLDRARAVSCRFIMNSSDGPLESGMIRCPPGPCFKGPAELLTLEKPARAAGLHHVKLPVADMERGREWFQRVLGFEVAGVRQPGQVGGPGRRGRPAGGLRIAGQRAGLGT
jgi:hypothetical protein